MGPTDQYGHDAVRDSARRSIVGNMAIPLGILAAFFDRPS
jgi:hypothetical protein